MSDQHPNVLFIMADQLGRHMLGCYGNPVVKTPNIDRLAREGVLANANYVQNPICMPSRASIFTGRYPSVCGTRSNGVPLRDSEVTLPQAMAWGGYSTFAAGKLHFRHQLNSADWLDGSHAEFEGTRPYYGFQEYHLSDDNRCGPYLRWVKKHHPQYADAVLNNPEQSPERIGNTRDGWVGEYPAEIHQSNWIADRTIDYIKRDHAGKPWFAFCSFADPHHPFNPPEPYASMYNDVQLPPLHKREGEEETFPPAIREHMQRISTGYTAEDYDTVRRLAYGMVSLIDDAVGRIYQTLQETDALKNTMIVFTSDHGEMLGEHGLLYKGAYHFDEILRTPLIWRWPESAAEGSMRVEALTQSLDLMPTILDVCHLPIPDAVQGESMRKLLEGQTAQGRSWVHTENYVLRWTPDGWLDDDINTLVTDDWKLTIRADGQLGQLFNRRDDPHELNNLWAKAEYATQRAVLTEKLVVCMSAARESTWRRETLW